MIDSHCHLNFNAFKNDYQEVIKRSFKNGIKAIINIGSNYKTSLKAIEIAKEFKNCYAAIGLHPIHVQEEKFDLEKFKELIIANKNYIKAIGETGFDYFHQPFDKEKQKEVFLKHIELAKEFDLPIIFHCRNEASNQLKAYNDLLFILRSLSFLPYGVIHCFSAHWQIAQEFLDLGFYLGFTGIITFKNCDDYLLEVVEKTPLEKILIETDAPYLAPEPYRGQRCEPWQVKFTALKIAEIKKIDFKKVIDQTTQNTKRLFKI
jgi:TatD DNase family protein